MPQTTDPKAAPSGPVARDPHNPAVEIPVYAGGEGPVSIPQSNPADRGDFVTEPLAPSPEPQAPETPAVPEPEPQAPEAPAEPGEPAAQPEGPSDSATPEDKQDDPPRNEKGQFIPRSRFNEVNDERKRLAQELAQLKAEKEAVNQVKEDAYDFDAKEAEYIDLVLDGRTAEAAALRKEIRAAERAEFEKVAAQKTVETTQQLTVQERIDQISQRYSAALPQFDPDSDEYNETLLRDVQAFYAGAIRTNRYPDAPTAFEAAIKAALKLHDIAEPGTQAPAAPAAPAPAAPAVPPRTAEKRVQAIVGQPPTLAKTGNSGAPETAATIKVNEITDKDLFALPEATRRRLRGDFL